MCQDDHLEGCLGAELVGEFFLRANPFSGEAIASCRSQLWFTKPYEQTVDVRIRFKADRVDYAKNKLSFIDYKSGKVLSTKKTQKARTKDFQNKVRSGDKLQAAAYSASHAYYRTVDPSLADSQGVLLYLKPQKDIPQRAFVVDETTRSDFVPYLGVSTRVSASAPRIGSRRIPVSRPRALDA